MNTQTCINLLFAFSLITGLIVQAIKKIIEDKEERPYNIIALIVGIIVGAIGTLLYDSYNSIEFNTFNIISAIIMGILSGICSTIGFDKVKQALVQIGKVV